MENHAGPGRQDSNPPLSSALNNQPNIPSGCITFGIFRQIKSGWQLKRRRRLASTTWRLPAASTGVYRRLTLTPGSVTLRLAHEGRPWLLTQPLLRIIAVLGLSNIRFPDAFRIVAAT